MEQITGGPCLIMDANVIEMRIKPVMWVVSIFDKNLILPFSQEKLIGKSGHKPR